MNLTHLDIFDSLINGDGLGGLTRLTWLSLDSDNFYDTDLIVLTQLQTLYLENTGISNECLVSFIELTKQIRQANVVVTFRKSLKLGYFEFISLKWIFLKV